MSARLFAMTVVVGSFVLCLCALAWWADNPQAIPGEMLVEEMMDDAPGASLVFVPAMFCGIGFAVVAFTIGTVGMFRAYTNKLLASLGVSYSAIVLTVALFVWVLPFFGYGSY